VPIGLASVRAGLEHDRGEIDFRLTVDGFAGALTHQFRSRRCCATTSKE
jgi:hypothetical protein